MCSLRLRSSGLMVGVRLLAPARRASAAPAASRSPRQRRCREFTSRSASVVSRKVRTIETRTRVHSSFVGHTWSALDSRAHTIDPSAASEMHSIGAIEPSSASTTSAIVISLAGRASM